MPARVISFPSCQDEAERIERLKDVWSKINALGTALTCLYARARELEQERPRPRSRRRGAGT